MASFLELNGNPGTVMNQAVIYLTACHNKPGVKGLPETG
jgi:hypothetical protein